MSAVRTRMVRHAFWSDEDLAELPILTRFVFLGLFAVADREGRFEDRPRRIKRLLFPNDEIDVNSAIEQLAQAGLVWRYIIDRQPLAQIKNFRMHQRPHPQEAKSTLPGISGDPAKSDDDFLD